MIWALKNPKNLQYLNNTHHVGAGAIFGEVTVIAGTGRARLVENLSSRRVAGQPSVGGQGFRDTGRTILASVEALMHHENVELSLHRFPFFLLRRVEQAREM